MEVNSFNANEYPVIKYQGTSPKCGDTYEKMNTLATEDRFFSGNSGYEKNFIGGSYYPDNFLGPIVDAGSTTLVGTIAGAVLGGVKCGGVLAGVAGAIVGGAVGFGVGMLIVNHKFKR